MIDASPWAAFDPVLPGRFRVGSAAAACVHATTQAAADLFAARGGDPGPVSVDVRHAAAHFRSERYLRLDGESPGGEDPLTGNYKALDGWVRLHCNYPHHRDAACQALGTTGLVAGVASRKAIEVEEAVVAAGGAAAAQRSRAEWAAHPQGMALRQLPLLSIEQIGAAPPMPLSKADKPLSGVRVLDLTHVIAGPVCGRTLAAHGADVLHVGAAHLPVVRPVLIDTQFGKRSTFVDLRDAQGTDTLRGLARDADVFVESFRPGSLAAKGFGPADLAALRPGIVFVEISAWGWEGPWRERRGFDSLAQMASGIAAGDPPVALPAQFLDHGSGWLAAYGVLTALRRRMETGGSWLVKVSLARTGLWFDELGQTKMNGELPIVDDLLTDTLSPFGLLTHIRMPGTLPGAQPNWEHGSLIPGSAKPEWW